MVEYSDMKFVGVIDGVPTVSCKIINVIDRIVVDFKINKKMKQNYKTRLSGWVNIKCYPENYDDVVMCVRDQLEEKLQYLQDRGIISNSDDISNDAWRFQLEKEKDVIDAKKYLEQLKRFQDCQDREIAHIDADDILCEILEKLGYTEIVKEYNKIDKYYI